MELLALQVYKMEKQSRTKYICSVTLMDIKKIISSGKALVLYNDNRTKSSVFTAEMAEEVFSAYGEDLLWMGEKNTKTKTSSKLIPTGIKNLKNFHGFTNESPVGHQITLWEC